MGILRSKNAVGYFYRDISTLWDRGSDGSCNIVGRDGLWNYNPTLLPRLAALETLYYMLMQHYHVVVVGENKIAIFI